MELMAPAGSPRGARAAIASGADALYLGLSDLPHQRDQCRNFSGAELDDLLALAGRRGVSVYVTFNSSYNEADYQAICDRIDRIAERGVAGVILADLGLASEVHRRHPALEIEYSVQGQCANAETAQILGELGVSRVVLDRNISLEEAAAIRAATGMEVDCFAFGFQCYSQDSLCYMGDYWSGMPCKVHCTQRVRFDQPGPRQGARRHLFMKYYSGLPHLDRMEDAGIGRIKIEGRHRSSRYVARVTRVFREAMDHLAACRAAGRPYRVLPAWERSLGIAAMGFEVTPGLFVAGEYHRRVDTHPPPGAPPLFLADTLVGYLESGKTDTLRSELRAAWDRLLRRPRPVPGPGRPRRFGGF